MLIFIWHLAIAAVFIVLLYLAATYSSFHHLIGEIKNDQEKLIALRQESQINTKLYELYKERYNRKVKDFCYRKTSVFAVIVLLIFKKLNVTFTPLD